MTLRFSQQIFYSDQFGYSEHVNKKIIADQFGFGKHGRAWRTQICTLDNASLNHLETKTFGNSS
jgi:hypothetical protein